MAAAAAKTSIVDVRRAALGESKGFEGFLMNEDSPGGKVAFLPSWPEFRRR